MKDDRELLRLWYIRYRINAPVSRRQAERLSTGMLIACLEDCLKSSTCNGSGPMHGSPDYYYCGRISTEVVDELHRRCWKPQKMDSRLAADLGEKT